MWGGDDAPGSGPSTAVDGVALVSRAHTGPAVKAFDWAGFLRRHPVLSSLDDTHVRWLVSDDVSTERTYPPGAVIFREHDEGDSVFLIASGTAEALIGAGPEPPIRLSLMGPGETFGEMAFFEGRRRSATVCARDACVVLEIAGQPLRRLADARPDIKFEVLLTVSERLRSKNGQLLALQLQAMESASRAKDEFLATLGHELRNPLGVIHAAIQVLGARAEPEERGRLVDMIARQVRHLARLVDDLLDVSRLVAGKLEVEMRPDDLLALAERSQAAFRALGRADEHVLSLSGEPVWVNADATRLEQVVMNLLDNAVKYTPPGGRIEVSVRPDGADAVLAVRDEGNGIPADVLPRVFEPFVQAAAARRRGAAGGLGLGLSLVKRLVELHGGSVSVASPGPGLGCEFVVRLPALPHAARPPEPAAPPLATGPARRVLVVDDHPDVREVLRLLLETWGHRVEEAETGERALELIARSRPDVALLDLGLPDLDGCAVARAVRASREGEACLLVAITGYGGAADRRRTAEAGFDAHLTKPIDEAKLARILGAGARGTVGA